ncbi:chromate transporter [Roseiterribacter gracilis]|uniref:Chromate transporter n=1 Tax=Roseiterribacter gracilis TaxID=2812848 RepID=A0A8S8X6I1_9PROT|nr:chromate transporter [Rhodospirillales bacterium TMPK1]
MSTLITLFVIFGSMSLLAIGGANSTVPEMQRLIVAQGWMDASQFAHLFAISQASPGPNMLIAPLVGWQVAGGAGALTGLIGICGPSCTLTYLLARAGDRFNSNPYFARVRAGLVPLSIGLVLATGAILAQSADHDVMHGLVTAVAAAGTIWTMRNPLWFLIFGAVVGALSL